jgi:hypothetical protein
MKTVQFAAIALLFAIVLPLTAFAEVSAVDRDTCINPATTAAPDAAVDACTHLIEALARGELGVPEGAAVHVARGNLYAVQGNVDQAITDYDRAILLD